ncbi:MAG: glycosyltransferase family 4 protein [Cyanobacteria bacterium P01_C01_bin.72]
MHQSAALITPILQGSGTGAAIYSQLLINGLSQRGFNWTVISEATESNPSEAIRNCTYHGIFPRRTGKHKQKVRDLWLYGLQNLAYLRIPEILERSKSQFVFVHSSFYNFPGIFPQVINTCLRGKCSNQKFLADVRDVLLTKQKAQHLDSYDLIIACSKNVQQRLISFNLSSHKIHYIPILQEPFSANFIASSNLLSTFNLNDTAYLLYVGMIKELKAVDLLLETFISYIYPINKSLKLVLAGYLKTNSKKVKEMLKAPGVVYVGNRSRQEVLQLLSKASLCINLSPNEALSRSSLESLAMRRPTLLPPNIPEFEHYCPEFVVRTRDPEVIAKRIMAALETKAIPNYPIEQHFPEFILKKYKELLC